MELSRAQNWNQIKSKQPIKTIFAIVAVQLLFSALFYPGFILDTTQHPCVIRIYLFIPALFWSSDGAAIQ